MNLLPKAAQLRIEASARAVSRTAIAASDHLVVILPARVTATTLAGLPFADAIRTARKRADDKSGIVSAIFNAKKPLGMTIATAPAVDSQFARLDLARRIISEARRSNPSAIAAVLLEPDAAKRNASAAALASAALAADFRLPTLKSKRPPASRLRKLTLHGAPDVDLDRIRIETDANGIARWLTALPPNVLDADALIDAARRLAARDGFRFRLYSESELAELGAGAFLAVARGNRHGNAGIVHLQRPGADDGRHLSLVGKGVCFDTGGINVKSATHMNGMHEDMEGAAVALATMHALASLAPDLHLDAWLAVTENRINSDAYTPNEVVTAINGTTIEVIHSDAEGRMALADTLTLASRQGADLMIDFATLTGACVTALTERYSGVFTNRPDLHPQLIAAGASSGERVWPFPLDADFDKALDSQTADIKQCTISGSGDHILAARFLSKFVDGKVPWVHVDLSAGNREGGLAHIPTDVTGFGVHFATRLVLDEMALTARESAS